MPGRILTGISLGWTAGELLAWGQVPAVVFLAGCILIMIYQFFKGRSYLRLLPFFVAILGFFACFYALKQIPLEQALEDGKKQSAVVYARIANKEIKNENDYLILNSCSISLNGETMTAKGIRAMVDEDEYTENVIGSWVKLSGNISLYEAAENDGQMDVREDYRCRGIYCQLKVEKLEKCTKLHMSVWDHLMTPFYWFRQKLLDGREILSDRMRLLAGDYYGGVLSALLFGDKETLDSDMQALFQKVGIGHILAVSGMHIGLAAGSLYSCVRRVSGSYNLGAAVGSAGAFVYALFSGCSVSSLRAAWMFSYACMAKAAGRGVDAPTAAAVSLLGILVLQPLQLFRSAFLLSYASCLAVSCALPLILDWMEKCGEILKKIVSMVVLQMFTMPIVEYSYFALPLYAPVLNLIVLALVTPLFIYSFAALAASWPLGTTLGKFMIQPSVWVLKSFVWLSEKTAKLPAAHWLTGRPSNIQLTICAVGLGMFLIYADHWKEKRKSSKRRGGKHRQKCLFVLLAVFALEVVILPCRSDGNLHIDMLSIGQGDCIAIRQGKQAILMDCGSSSKTDIWRYIVSPYLESHGIAMPEAVIVTHTDTDHISGLEELLKTGEYTGKILLAAGQSGEENYQTLMGLSADNSCTVVYPDEDMEIRTEKYALEFLYPSSAEVKERVETSGSQVDINALSQIWLLSSGEFHMLFTGDADITAQQLAMDTLQEKYGALTVNVLKTAHHGSANNSDHDLLSRISPSLAIISCGKNNRYGHPSRSVLEAMEQQNIFYEVTSESGEISITVKGNRYICQVHG